ncbi:hypothetical protein [Petroclostridium sp. X23]|uniref:hypothetical protein n=1 Tax=Petroclostridium sp. X23 TaxID=3045146 RepID=UPI0024ADA86A|nr:hypothetical protein [Petroclostridium sp. X23]WHH60096.1 hypothetical protein QKW49_04980 [Petroclostridium sp. X23]
MLHGCLENTFQEDILCEIEELNIMINRIKKEKISEENIFLWQVFDSKLNERVKEYLSIKQVESNNN